MSQLSRWAIEALEAEIAARGEATHYEAMRREGLAGVGPTPHRLALFEARAQADGYRIVRSTKTGGIVIQHAERTPQQRT